MRGLPVPALGALLQPVLPRELPQQRPLRVGHRGPEQPPRDRGLQRCAVSGVQSGCRASRGDLGGNSGTWRREGQSRHRVRESAPWHSACGAALALGPGQCLGFRSVWSRLPSVATGHHSTFPSLSQKRDERRPVSGIERPPMTQEVMDRVPVRSHAQVMSLIPGSRCEATN